MRKRLVDARLASVLERLRFSIGYWDFQVRLELSKSAGPVAVRFGELAIGGFCTNAVVVRWELKRMTSLG